MKIKVLLTLIIIMQMLAAAQQMPLVYDVENTGADCPKPPLLSFDQLPVIQSLPDPFQWSDGRGRIESFSDWRCRRAEIAAEVQRYELGVKPAPPAPGNLEASFSNNVMTVIVREGGKSLTLTVTITVPSTGTGPFPAVIGIGGGAGSLPSDLFTSRGIALISYNYSEVAPWTQSGRGQGAFYQLFPDTKVGYFTAWAWGVSRLIDGLEFVPEANIDLKHLAITGCSFAGKIALFSGALDERIALTIPQEPGGGGDAAWRVTETLSGSRETLRNAQSYGWYYADVNIFNNAVTKFPYDHHEVMAMVAPRALFILGNPSQEWLAEESGHVASKAAQKVWEALGVPDRFGFSKVGGHNHCAMPESQRPEVGAFIDKFLLGIDTVNTNIAITPYTTNLSEWITWSTPTLVDKPSYLEQAVLVYPADLQKDLGEEVTFSWNKATDADEYFIQISTDPVFNTISFSDSTTDTVKTISGLSEGKNYYWRVQVKNADGIAGPYSEQRSFSTFIALPNAPELISAEPVPNRQGYIKLSWSAVEHADKYIIQVSNNEDFTAIVKTDSTTSDTVKTLNGYVNDRRYYWRVRAQNIAGNSEWSVSSFAILAAPAELVLEIAGSNEISLNWKDNSAAEEGYIIERIESPETSFSVLDTVSGDAYSDAQVEQTKTYTYRVKAYAGVSVSAYTNEATLLLVGVNDGETMPTQYSLSQNFPNPFNPATKIKFALPKAGLTKVIIYNILGKEIQTLLNKELEAGRHEITVDAGNFPSGVYFYKIQSGSFMQTKKMIVMK
jgi:hypothetical protein